MGHVFSDRLGPPSREHFRLGEGAGVFGLGARDQVLYAASIRALEIAAQ